MMHYHRRSSSLPFNIAEVTSSAAKQNKKKIIIECFDLVINKSFLWFVMLLKHFKKFTLVTVKL